MAAESEKEEKGLGGFIALMAFAMSMVALSIDTILPAFPDIARDLEVRGANDIQLVITLLFVGLALGQLFYGPLSDSIGRKPAIYIGFGLLILGSLISMLSQDFHVMLAGRLLQGIGAAGPRTVTVALIRDRFHGSEMARVMSFIMTIFILVPIFAPALGQLILVFTGWRSIFAVFIVLVLAVTVWLGLGQPETLAPENRKPFNLRNVANAFLVVVNNRVTVVYTLVAALVSGAFLSYLNTSQQIFQVQYELGLQFPIYFGIMAVAVGLASLLNGQMVMRLGMHVLTKWALYLLTMLSWLFLAICWYFDGHPPLWLFMTIGFTLFFSIGVLWGNLNSIAMEPLGHVAGTAAAAIGSTNTLIAAVLGFLIGQTYDGSLLPIALAFVVLSMLSLLLTGTIKSPVGAGAGR